MKLKLFLILGILGLSGLSAEVANSHVVGSTKLKDGAPHWHTMPYDLKYDSKWIHFPGSKAEMNPADDVVVSGEGDFSSSKPYGMRFATTNEWEEFISGHRVRVTITTRSSTKDLMQYKIAYLTNSDGFSGWYHSFAHPEGSTFSFEYDVPEVSELKKDFIIVVPEDQNTDLIISSAQLELVSE